MGVLIASIVVSKTLPAAVAYSVEHRPTQQTVKGSNLEVQLQCELMYLCERYDFGHTLLCYLSQDKPAASF
jgi:hypothetical protein